MKKIYYLCILSVFLFAGCERESGPGPKVENERTVLVYLVANNSLKDFAVPNIESMLKGATAKSMGASRLLIYYVPYGSETQQLLEVVVGKRGDSKTVELKTYNNGTSSMEPATIRNVIADTKILAPAKGYGLILWSHATGWFPAGSKLRSVGYGQDNLWYRAPDALQTKSFGDDGGKGIEIVDLATALNGTVFEFIIFDCCFMSSIEVWYELRNCAKYIISSAAEIMGNGFPYSEIVPLIMAKNFDPKVVAESYIDYYSNRASVRSGTISYAVTSQLEPLAKSVKAIYNGHADGVVNINTVQYYENMYTHVFHDMDQYVVQLCTDNNLYAQFKRQLDLVIPYEGHTSLVYSAFGGGGYFALERSCGVSTYIPRESLEVQYGYTSSYMKTAWARAIGL